SRAAAATSRLRTVPKPTDLLDGPDPLTGRHASRQRTASDGGCGSAQGAARRAADGTPLDHVHPRFLPRLRGCLDPYLAPQQAAVALGDGLVVVLAPTDPLAVMAELVGEARKRIVAVLTQLVGVELRGLARAGHPHTDHPRLVVGQDHSAELARALSLALLVARATANAIAENEQDAIEPRPAGKAPPEACAAGKPLSPAVPHDPHASSQKHGSYRCSSNRPVPRANWRLPRRLARMHP